MAEDQWRLGHRPALDGLRGVAIALVLLGHLRLPGFRWAAGNGVVLFFVLSGFLITALLVEEHRTNDRVSLRGFYVRRALRLLPALVAFVAAMLALGWASTRDALWALSYVGNWNRAHGGTLGALSHTWSLALEEQFYLLFPLAFIALARHRAALVLALIATVVASTMARWILWVDDASFDRVYFGSDTRADAIATGCIVGIVATGGWLRAPSKRTVIGAVVIFAALSALGTPQMYHEVSLTLVTGASVVTVVTVLTRPAPWLTFAPLQRLGRLSYALYLWHLPVFWQSRALLGDGVVWMVFSVSASVLLALLSAHLVEQPFLRWKVRMGQQRHPSEMATTGSS